MGQRFLEVENDLVSVVRDGAIASVIIAREEKLNALSRATLDAIRSAFADVDSIPDLRCVLLRSAGNRYFAAGGDLIELNEVRTETDIHDMADHARDVLDRIRACQVPVLAVLNGDAIGGGAELAAACDFRAMRVGAHIGFVQGRLAINSAWGGGADLAALVGPARSLRMMARCELVEARVALDWGLADVVAEESKLDDAVRDFVGPIVNQSAGSLRAFLNLARAHRHTEDYLERRRLERDALIETWQHPDHWAAVERFLSRKQG